MILKERAEEWTGMKAASRDTVAKVCPVAGPEAKAEAGSNDRSLPATPCKGQHLARGVEAQDLDTCSFSPRLPAIPRPVRRETNVLIIFGFRGAVLLREVTRFISTGSHDL